MCSLVRVFFFSFLPLSDAFSTHWCFIVFSVYSRLPLCILNALWPLSISRGKPIKVSSNQEMVSAVVSRWCSHSSLSGSARRSLTLAVLYILWCLRQREGSHLFLSWTNQLHSLWWIQVEGVCVCSRTIDAISFNSCLYLELHLCCLNSCQCPQDNAENTLLHFFSDRYFINV